MTDFKEKCEFDQELKALEKLSKFMRDNEIEIISRGLEHFCGGVGVDIYLYSHEVVQFESEVFILNAESIDKARDVLAKNKNQLPARVKEF